ncbi:MAG: MAPEG family protein [Spongiibacteraceae bacterium]
MESLAITSVLTAVLAVQMFILSFMVSLRRVLLGRAEGDIAKYPYQDGRDETLRRRMRAFGNFAEYTPICLILLGILEWRSESIELIWGLGLAFIAGRILHALGMLLNPHFPLPRIIGMLCTYAVLLVSAYLVLEDALNGASVPLPSYEKVVEFFSHLSL